MAATKKANEKGRQKGGCTLRAYEVIFILDPALGDDGVDAAIAAASGVVIKEGGEVAEVQKWGKKRLAYEIKKRREGHYAFFRLQAPARAVTELERHLNIAEPVLKFLTVLVQTPRRKVTKAKAPAVAPRESGTPGMPVGTQRTGVEVQEA
jgi:small subunit ribosomal protein S6